MIAVSRSLSPVSSTLRLPGFITIADGGLVRLSLYGLDN